MLWYICIALTGGSEPILPTSVGLMAGGLPAATVGPDPTVFVGWDVSLVCNVLCLLIFFVRFVCAGMLRFGS